MRPHVFISYSHLDRLAADAICAVLEAANIQCWMAPRDIEPGAEWAEAIEAALNQCLLVVLIFSSNANESRQVRREVELSIRKDLKIIPVRIERFEPTSSMAYFMAGLHWFEAAVPPLEQHLQMLVGSLSALPQLAALRSAPQVSDPSLVGPRQPSLARTHQRGNSFSREQSANEEERNQNKQQQRTQSLQEIRVYRYQPRLLIALPAFLFFTFTFSAMVTLSYALVAAFREGRLEDPPTVAVVGLILLASASAFCVVQFAAGLASRLRKLDNKLAFLREIIVYNDRLSLPQGLFLNRLEVIKYSDIKSLYRDDHVVKIYTDRGKFSILGTICMHRKQFNELRAIIYRACGIKL
jgi:hypothetical protein